MKIKRIEAIAISLPMVKPLKMAFEEVKSAENDHNVHRGAAALALKLYRMDSDKRDEMLRHFDSYRLQLGFGRQDDLFNDPAAIADEGASFTH